MDHSTSGAYSVVPLQRSYNAKHMETPPTVGAFGVTVLTRPKAEMATNVALSSVQAPSDIAPIFIQADALEIVRTGECKVLIMGRQTIKRVFVGLKSVVFFPVILYRGAKEYRKRRKNRPTVDVVEV